MFAPPTQVAGAVQVRWVRARALGRAGAGALARRLDCWRAAAQRAQGLLSERAPDLLTL